MFMKRLAGIGMRKSFLEQVIIKQMKKIIKNKKRFKKLEDMIEKLNVKVEKIEKMTMQGNS